MWRFLHSNRCIYWGAGISSVANINKDMRVNDVFAKHSLNEEYHHTLLEQCSEFLHGVGAVPLLKNLPTQYNDFHKVKVRKRKNLKETSEDFVKTFNGAFDDRARELRERAVFANGEVSFEPVADGRLEPFYIFPVDGFKFMYSKEVENSSADYKTVFDALFEEFGYNHGNEVIVELLKFTYTSENLREGIEQGSEIIIYNVPYFYAVRVSTVSNYADMLSSIQDML
jgi:hypothetical protein